MDTTLLSCFKDIRKGTGWTTDKNVKESIERTTKKLESKKDSSRSEILIYEYFEPIELGLSSKTIKCKEASLHSIITLINEGFIGSKEKYPADESCTFLDHVIYLVYEYFDIKEDNLFVTIIRTLDAIYSVENLIIRSRPVFVALQILLKIYPFTKLEATKVEIKSLISKILKVSFTALEDGEKLLKKNKRSRKNSGVILSGINQSFDTSITGNQNSELKIPCFYSAVLTFLDYTYSVETLRKNSLVASQDLIFDDYQLDADDDIPLLDSLPTDLHRDILRIIIYLSRLTMDDTNEDSLLICSLILEIFSETLQIPADIFNSYDAYIISFQKYLLKSLLINCIALSTSLVLTSMEVFCLIIDYYYYKLGTEIDLFVSKVFIPILTSDNTPFENKHKVYFVVTNRQLKYSQKL